MSYRFPSIPTEPFLWNHSIICELLYFLAVFAVAFSAFDFALLLIYSEKNNTKPTATQRRETKKIYIVYTTLMKQKEKIKSKPKSITSSQFSHIDADVSTQELHKCWTTFDTVGGYSVERGDEGTRGCFDVDSHQYN